MFSWTSITARGDAGHTTGVLLSPDTFQLLYDLLAFCNTRWMWTDGDWDAITAAIAEADDELRRNTMIGQILFRAGPMADNELLCDGASYNRADYPALYDALDAQFQTDADHFVTPSLLNKFLYPVREFVIGASGGEASHTLTEAEIPVMGHTVLPHTHTEVTAVPAVINGGLEAPAAAALPAAGLTGAATVSISNHGGGQPHQNMPPWIGMMPCIVAY